MRNRQALQKLFGEIAERFVDRPGGYTRVLRLGTRLGDNAEMAIIELLPEGYEKPAKAGRPAPAPKAAPAPEAVAEEAAPEAVAEEAASEAVAAEAASEAVAEEAAPEGEEKTEDSE